MLCSSRQQGQALSEIALCSYSLELEEAVSVSSSTCAQAEVVATSAETRCGWGRQAQAAAYLFVSTQMAGISQIDVQDAADSYWHTCENNAGQPKSNISILTGELTGS